MTNDEKTSVPPDSPQAMDALADLRQDADVLPGVRHVLAQIKNPPNGLEGLCLARPEHEPW
jgi:hypothetical protein